MFALLALASLTSDRGTIHDSFRTIYKDNTDYTAFRLRVLRHRLIRHARERGQLPSSLALLHPSFDTVSGDGSPGTDGWNRRIQYSPNADLLGFELRSFGPDGEGGTNDDIVLRANATDSLDADSLALDVGSPQS